METLKKERRKRPTRKTLRVRTLEDKVHLEKLPT
jgi:hypothetical protein